MTAPMSELVELSAAYNPTVLLAWLNHFAATGHARFDLDEKSLRCCECDYAWRDEAGVRRSFAWFGGRKLALPPSNGVLPPLGDPSRFLDQAGYQADVWRQWLEHVITTGHDNWDSDDDCAISCRDCSAEFYSELDPEEPAVRDEDGYPILVQVRRYLEGLEWDGIYRVDEWLHSYLGADDSPLNKTLGARWLISAVARAFQPGCTVDHVLVLEGEQGIGKSAALRALCPRDQWLRQFMSIVPHWGMTCSEAEAEELRGAWLVELADVQTLTRSEAEALRVFVARNTDHYRPRYASNPSTFERGCVFAATAVFGATADGTHHYRGGVQPVQMREPVNIEALRGDRDQLWAEAVHRYLRGEAWFMGEDEALAAAEAAVANGPGIDEVYAAFRREFGDIFRRGIAPTADIQLPAARRDEAQRAVDLASTEAEIMSAWAYYFRLLSADIERHRDESRPDVPCVLSLLCRTEQHRALIPTSELRDGDRCIVGPFRLPHSRTARWRAYVWDGSWIKQFEGPVDVDKPIGLDGFAPHDPARFLSPDRIHLEGPVDIDVSHPLSFSRSSSDAIEHGPKRIRQEAPLDRFEREVTALLNGVEHLIGDTPDYVAARFVRDCLKAFAVGRECGSTVAGVTILAHAYDRAQKGCAAHDTTKRPDPGELRESVRQFLLNVSDPERGVPAEEGLSLSEATDVLCAWLEGRGDGSIER